KEGNQNLASVAKSAPPTATSVSDDKFVNEHVLSDGPCRGCCDIPQLRHSSRMERRVNNEGEPKGVQARRNTVHSSAVSIAPARGLCRRSSVSESRCRRKGWPSRIFPVRTSPFP